MFNLLAESNEIAERKEIINQLWIDLKDLAEARTQALAGAKEIHTFDRDALDTKERIQVKGFCWLYMRHQYIRIFIG